MTDRELLELAAKAAGVCLHPEDKLHHSYGNWGCDTTCTVCGRNPSRATFRPITDDGDALRLYTRLPFHELYVSEIGATVSWRRGDGSGHGYKCDEYADEHAGDINAATRRAIVRAAAEIGKAMP